MSCTFEKPSPTPDSFFVPFFHILYGSIFERSTAMPTQRVSASGKNLRFSVAGQLITVIFNFVIRRAFIGILGTEYTGFSGLCGHVLNFLSLLEPGFDAACVYCLYKPLAYGDRELVGALMTYIKKVYRIIGTVTFIVGVLAMPVVFLMSSENVDPGFGSVIYLLMLFEMSISYFFTHRSILPSADQKSYTVAVFGYASFTVSRFLQLIILGETGSYILYIISGILCGLLGEILLYRRIGKMYPYIKKSAKKIPADVKKEATSKAASLFFRKAGAVLCGSADNMAIFAFLGLGAGTVYSNYTMLSGICLAFISVIIGSAGASVGNLGVTSGKYRMMKIYSTALFAIFMLTGFFAISLFFTYPLIVELWLGSEMVLDMGTTALFCVSMLISGLRRPGAMFIDSMGLFDKEKFKSVTEAFITVCMTLILTPQLGIRGVLTGQLCAVLLFSFPWEIYILFRHGFGERIGIFLRELSGYVFALLLSFVLSAALCFCTRGQLDGIGLILIRILICAFSVTSVFFILFFDSERFGQAFRYGIRMLQW